MKKLIVVALASTIIFVNALLALALESPGSFKIASISMSGANNYHLRINSDTPANWHCYGGPTYPAWSYINESDDGAKGKIAALLTAYALGNTVHVSTEMVGSYCHIVELSIAP